MAQAAAAPAPKVDYGQDAPVLMKSMFSRALWTLLFALVLWWNSRADYPGPAARMAGAIVLIAAGFAAVGFLIRQYSSTGKLALRDRILDSLNLAGAERVLDVGCARGLFAIGAAKRMGKTGKVTAIDCWDPPRVKGNTMDAARENAKAEGVSEKIRLEAWDARKLVYPDNHFDAVVSSCALQDVTEPEPALREMVRVLKPGGRLVIHGFLDVADYAKALQGAAVTGLVCSPHSLNGRTLEARKA